jgi:hypothetical protein
MSEIVNLRQARKRAARGKQQVEAAANRAKFGQTKEARKLAQAEAEKVQKTLDGAKRDTQSED